MKWGSNFNKLVVRLQHPCILEETEAGAQEHGDYAPNSMGADRLWSKPFSVQFRVLVPILSIQSIYITRNISLPPDKWIQLNSKLLVADQSQWVQRARDQRTAAGDVLRARVRQEGTVAEDLSVGLTHLPLHVIRRLATKNVSCHCDHFPPSTVTFCSHWCLFSLSLCCLKYKVWAVLDISFIITDTG